MNIHASAIAALLLVLLVGCGSTPSKAINQGAATTSGAPADERFEDAAGSAGAKSDHPIFVARDTGSLSVGPEFRMFRDYLEELVRSVDTEWNKILATSVVRPPSGSKVSVRFTLNSEGVVTRIVEVEETAGKQGTYACLHAIQDPQPFRPWTHEMIDALGREQTLTFHFHYW